MALAGPGSSQTAGTQQHDVACSVLIAAHDTEQFIAETLDSAHSQLRVGDEIIVVDDASSDRTAEVVQGHASRPHLIRLDRNRGAAAARNVAAGAARNGLLVFLDADDCALPGRLDAHRAASVRGASISYGRMSLIDEQGHHLGWHRGTALASKVPLRTQITYESPIAFSASAVRRDAFLDVGGFREAIPSSEDWDLWARLIWAGATTTFIDAYLCAYRLRRGSKTTNVREKHVAYIRVRKQILEAIEAPPDPLAEAAFRRRATLTSAHNAWRNARMGQRSAYWSTARFASSLPLSQFRYWRARHARPAAGR